MFLVSLTHAQDGCTDAVRKSVLKVHSGRKEKKSHCTKSSH